jgi:hypothetical protein
VVGCALVGWLSVGRLEGQLDDRSNGLLVAAPDASTQAAAAPAGQIAPEAEPAQAT